MQKSFRLHIAIPSVLLGCVFLVSGWLKGVDPYGTCLRMEEYFRVWGWGGFVAAYAMAWSVCLCAAELWVGLLLLLGVFRRVVAWVACLMMALFTVISAWLSFSFAGSAIVDCGCFGEAFHLSHEATFAKNLFLLALSVWLVVAVRRCPLWPSGGRGWRTALVGIVFSLAIPVWSAVFLPPFDFLPYNRGARLEGDSGFALFDSRYEEVTDSVLRLSHDRPLVALVAREAFTEEERKLLEPFMEAARSGQAELSLWASPSVESVQDIPVCYTDDVTLKSLLRAEKGFLILEDGVIRGKWTLRACAFGLPSTEEGIRRMAAWDSGVTVRYALCVMLGLCLMVWIRRREMSVR